MRNSIVFSCDYRIVPPFFRAGFSTPPWLLTGFWEVFWLYVFTISVFSSLIAVFFLNSRQNWLVLLTPWSASHFTPHLLKKLNSWQNVFWDWCLSNGPLKIKMKCRSPFVSGALDLQVSTCSADHWTWGREERGVISWESKWPNGSQTPIFLAVLANRSKKLLSCCSSSYEMHWNVS